MAACLNRTRPLNAGFTTCASFSVYQSADLARLLVRSDTSIADCTPFARSPSVGRRASASFAGVPDDQLARARSPPPSFDESGRRRSRAPTDSVVAGTRANRQHALCSSSTVYGMLVMR
jgi:hypothetical protein